MGRSYWRGLVAAGCLGLSACVGQPLSPADAVASLRSGRALLTCHEPCLAEWQRAEPEAAKLEAAARWTDLAVLVLQTGYEDDLSLYYLGRAAEGLGYPGAAASYYRQSTRLSGTQSSCQNLSRMCGGVALPKSALLREAAIGRDLDRLRYPRHRLEPRTSLRPGAPPSEAEAPIAANAPGEAAGPPVSLTPPPSPPPPRAGRSNTDYIEPPPAPR